MNKVILMGRITKDLELKQLSGGQQMCRFSIAVNRPFSKRDGSRDVDFINLVAWRKNAEFLCRYFSRGKMIVVVGSLQTRIWETPAGERKYFTDVAVDEAFFCGDRNSDDLESNFPQGSSNFEGDMKRPMDEAMVQEANDFASMFVEDNDDINALEAKKVDDTPAKIEDDLSSILDHDEGDIDSDDDLPF